MNITAQKSTLLSAILPYLKAVAKTAANPVLETFMLKAVKGDAESQLIITGYDLEKGIKCVIPAVVREEGEILVSSSRLSAIINNLPDTAIEISSDEKLKVKITAGSSVFEIAGLSTDVFPTLPELRGDRGFGISQGLLKRMTRQTSFAASNIDTKPFMTGLYFTISDGVIKIVGCDGYRLALRKETLDFEKSDTELEFIVPAKTMINLADILADSESPVNIQLSRKHIIFATEEFTFFSRLIEGEYLDYDRAMPKAPTIFLNVALDDVIESINRVALIVDQKAKSPVRCIVAPKMLKLTCMSALGSVNDELEAETRGDEIDLEIGFNHIFLKDAFEKARDCGDETVIIEMTSAQTGILIKPISGDSFLYFILPVRLQ